jgi:hypothetical protein
MIKENFLAEEIFDGRVDTRGLGFIGVLYQYVEEAQPDTQRGQTRKQNHAGSGLE